jgi:hypothetical protein
LVFAIGTPATSGNNSANTTWTVAYPSGISAGDLLVSITATNKTTAGTDYDSNDGGFDLVMADRAFTVLKKVATGSESGSFVITGSGSARRHASVCVALSGANGTAKSTTVNSASTDPPAVTPDGGANDYLYIAVASTRRNDNAFTVAPSGYGGLVERSSTNASVDTSTNNCRIGVAFKGTTGSTTDNPGDWGTQSGVQ